MKVRSILGPEISLFHLGTHLETVWSTSSKPKFSFFPWIFWGKQQHAKYNPDGVQGQQAGQGVNSSQLGCIFTEPRGHGGAQSTKGRPGLSASLSHCGTKDGALPFTFSL